MQLGDQVMRNRIDIAGVTLIELMIVIVITAILLTVAIPSFRDIIDRNRLKAASENLYSDLQFAKSESIKRNQKVYIVFNATSSSPTWSYYLTENDACDLTESNPKDTDFCGTGDLTNGRMKRQVENTDYPNIKITSKPSSGKLSFSPLRGTAAGGTITMESARQKQMSNVVSGMGRIRLCSPTNSQNVPGYPSC
jgi:type IV fimbrial biogenesis protein FimT